MDFIRQWKLKTLDAAQVFADVVDASQRRFYSQVFFYPTVLPEVTEA